MQSIRLPDRPFTDRELRDFVVERLDQEPDATFQRMHAHLRSLQGRTLEQTETEELRTAYETELANPTGAHRIGAVEARQIAAHQPFALRWIEKVGAVIGLIPLVFHLQTVTPGVVNKTTGVMQGGGVYDLVAMLGGFLAVILGALAMRQGWMHISQRQLHLALGAVIVLLGVYQSLLGLGILHKLGMFATS